MARHGAIQPLDQIILRQVCRLAGDVAIAGEVANAIVHDVACCHLVQGAECRNVGVWGLVYEGKLK